MKVPWCADSLDVSMEMGCRERRIIYSSWGADLKDPSREQGVRGMSGMKNPGCAHNLDVPMGMDLGDVRTIDSKRVSVHQTSIRLSFKRSLEWTP